MVPFAKIRGQPRAQAQLRRILAERRVAHAYLFTGPPGCGKYTTAVAFAAALNCRASDESSAGCGSCSACTRILAGTHPDVQTVPRQGAAQIIPIETIRKQLIPQLAHPPHEADYRVFLLEEATSLPGPSANALLKTLEEPPARTVFVLCTAAPGQLLPTLRSRCQEVAFAELAADVKAELGGDQDTAADLRARCGELVQAIDRGGLAALGTAAAAAKEREHVAAILRLLAREFHHQAKQAARGHRLDRAAVLARRAAQVLEVERAVSLHNAHGQLALENLVAQLHLLQPPP